MDRPRIVVGLALPWMMAGTAMGGGQAQPLRVGGQMARTRRDNMAMSRHETRTIEELTETLIDYRGKTPVKTKSGIRLITAKVIKGGRILDGENEYIAEEDYSAWMRRGLPQQWDILITTEAPLGEVAILRTNEKIALAQRVILLRGRPNIIDQRYYYHAMKSPFVQGELAARSSGTTVLGIKQSELRQVRIPYFHLDVQRKIAAILSAYDDLIENNTRRIKILEEMAQALYREWFVHFRFPGHEPAPLTDSPLGKIPEDWEFQRLDELCSAVLDGDWIETKDQGGEDYRLLQISNIGSGDFVETGKLRYVTQGTFDRLRCTEIRPDDILIARMPTPIGRGWLARKMPWRMITAVDVAIARPDCQRTSPLFLLHFWNQPSTLSAIEKQSSGTTRPRITRRELCAMRIPTPPLVLQEQFAANTRPMLDFANILRDKNTNLRRTRDLLLPKLVSGEIDVSSLEKDRVQARTA